MSPRCPEDGHDGWDARVEAFQERKLLEASASEETTDESLVSIVEHSPMLMHQLGPKGIKQVRGQLVQDQQQIASLEAKGVSL